MAFTGLVRDFLVAVGDGERELEAARAEISNIGGYNPAGLFALVDKNSNGELTAEEIVDFLKATGEHGIEVTEVQVLIDFFDSDGSGTLNPTEFTHLVLPCENNELR